MTQGSLTQVLIVRILGKLNRAVSHGVVGTQDTRLTVCKGHIENEWNRPLCWGEIMCNYVFNHMHVSMYVCTYVSYKSVTILYTSIKLGKYKTLWVSSATIPSVHAHIEGEEGHTKETYKNPGLLLVWDLLHSWPRECVS